MVLTDWNRASIAKNNWYSDLMTESRLSHSLITNSRRKNHSTKLELLESNGPTSLNQPRWNHLHNLVTLPIRYGFSCISFHDEDIAKSSLQAEMSPTKHPKHFTCFWTEKPWKRELPKASLTSAPVSLIPRRTSFAPSIFNLMNPSPGCCHLYRIGILSIRKSQRDICLSQFNVERIYKHSFYNLIILHYRFSW